MEVRLPPNAVVGDIVTVSLTEATQAASSTSDADGYEASATLTQADIDARSVSVEFDKAPTEGQYVLEEKVTDSTGNTVKFSDSRDVTLEASSTTPSDDDDGGSFGFGALIALLGLGLFRRRR